MQVAVVEQLMLARHDSAGERYHVHALDAHGSRLVLHAREVEHLLHQARQAPRLRGDRLQMVGVRGVHAILHGLHRGKHGHERRAQLMRNVRGQTTCVLEVFLQALRHLIEGLAKLIDLVVALHARACR